MSDLLQLRFFNEVSKKYGLTSNAGIEDIFTIVQQTDFEIEGDPIILQTEVTIYPNKVNYLFVRWQEDPNLDVPVSMTEGHLGRVIDVCWQMKYVKYPDQYSRRERTKLIVDIMKSLRDNQANGIGDQKLEDGDMVVSYPYGSKIDMGPTLASRERGRIQRAYFDRKFGMSKPYSDGWCYGIVQDGKIGPLVK